MTRSSMTRCVAAIGIAALALAGCAGEKSSDSSASARAVEVLQAKANESAQAAEYALGLAARASSPRTAQLLIDAANSTAYRTSSLGLKGLLDRPLPESQETLRAAFLGKSGALKQIAAVGLARGGDAEAIAWLKGQVAADNAGVPNAEVVLALAAGGADPAAEEVLAREMKSKDQARQDAAYAVLGRIRKAWATDLLLEGLRGESGEDRAQAIVALGATGDPRAVAAIVPFVNTRGLVLPTIDALGALGGDAAVAELRRAAQHKEAIVRAHAGAALWRAGDEATAKSTLEPLIGDADPKIRHLIAVQLAEVQAPGADEYVAKLVKDTEPEIRIDAMRALLEHGGTGLEPLYLELTGASDYATQSMALECLARYGGPGALATVTPLLESPNPYVAIAASIAVLEIEARSETSAG